MSVRNQKIIFPIVGNRLINPFVASEHMISHKKSKSTT